MENINYKISNIESALIRGIVFKIVWGCVVLGVLSLIKINISPIEQVEVKKGLLQVYPWIIGIVFALDGLWIMGSFTESKTRRQKLLGPCSIFRKDDPKLSACILTRSNPTRPSSLS